MNNIVIGIAGGSASGKNDYRRPFGGDVSRRMSSFSVTTTTTNPIPIYRLMQGKN